MKRKLSDHAFDGANFIFLILIGLICFYPFWYVLIVSLNDNGVSSYVNVIWWPKQLTLQNYRTVFASPWLLNGYRVSGIRTGIATFLSVVLSGGMAYALTRQDLVGRKFFNIFILVPMYLSGGLIPLYLLYKTMHLLDTFTVLVIGGLISSWNIILLRTAIAAMPHGLVESANIDGANDLRIYFQIVIPCSKPIFATVTLFVAVAFWNDWFAGDIFISSDSLKPIQTIMLNIINNAKASDMAKKMGSATGQNIGTMVESIKMSTIMLTVMPIVIVYPFLQKYFVKGIMIGSLKG